MDYDSQPDEGSGGTPRARSGGITAVVLVPLIIGAIAGFMGLFILFAGDDQSVGFGGDLSWRVGDIHAAWAYGLLAVGALLLLFALIRLMRRD